VLVNAQSMRVDFPDGHRLEVSLPQVQLQFSEGMKD